MSKKDKNDGSICGVGVKISAQDIDVVFVNTPKWQLAYTHLKINQYLFLHKFYKSRVYGA